MRSVLCAMVVALGFAHVSATSAQSSGNDEGGEPPAVAPEPEVPLPAYPQSKSLLQFEVGVTNPNNFFVDSTSIAVGEDGVVRYVLVVRSASGVDNVSFEGIRCATGEKRLYAMGRADGTWVRSRNKAWVDVNRTDTRNQHHRLLADRFLCDNGVPIRTAREGIEAIRRNEIIPRKPY